LFLLGEDDMKLSEVQLFEKIYNREWDEDILFEMANIHSDTHGINNIVIWVGMANKQHGLRVKVSNKKDKFDRNDHFNIQMPSLDYDSSRVAKWITGNHMNSIFKWIKLNQKLLYDYETGKIDNTYAFLKKISKV
jgi:hypothetical protein